MKSSTEDLRKRGFITTKAINKVQHYSNNELILLINSPNAVERSVAINLISNRLNSDDLNFVKILLEKLCIEKWIVEFYLYSLMY